jgi:hypothetical protein
MFQKTHILLAEKILYVVGFRNIYIDKKAVYPDFHKKEYYPGFDDLPLNEHHDIDLNRMRIKKLIEYAKEWFQPYDFNEALNHYCSALHFLCDSSIPSLKDGGTKQIQEEIENQFSTIVFDYDWNIISTYPKNKSQMEKLVDNFFDDMPLQSYSNTEIKKTMKKTYQTGLQLAKYTFARK